MAVQDGIGVAPKFTSQLSFLVELTFKYKVISKTLPKPKPYRLLKIFYRYLMKEDSFHTH